MGVTLYFLMGRDNDFVYQQKKIKHENRKKHHVEIDHSSEFKTSYEFLNEIQPYSKYNYQNDKALKTNNIYSYFKMKTSSAE